MVHDETELRGRDAEHAVRGGDPQVACDDQLCARPECGSVDGSDHGHGEGAEATQHPTEIGREPAFFDTGQIGTGAERRGRSGQHDDANIVQRRRRDPFLGVEQFEDRCVIERISAFGAVECDQFDAFVSFHSHHGAVRYALPMAADESTTPTQDPILIKRAKIAKWTLLANRVGYLFVALAMALFIIAFAVGFNSTMATLVIIAFLIGCALLAPSIILGYAVKAAYREDRERGL